METVQVSPEQVIRAKAGAKSAHYQRVASLMRLARQSTPDEITHPSNATCLLRAALVFEEVMEKINALGVQIILTVQMADGDKRIVVLNNPLSQESPVVPHSFEKVADADLVGLVDACCDVSVVNIGTLVAIGVADESVLRLVDESNLDKFGPGHGIRADGKLIKPPNFQPPDLLAVLIEQGYRPDSAVA